MLWTLVEHVAGGGIAGIASLSHPLPLAGFQREDTDWCRQLSSFPTTADIHEKGLAAGQEFGIGVFEFALLNIGSGDAVGRASLGGDPE